MKISNGWTKNWIYQWIKCADWRLMGLRITHTWIVVNRRDTKTQKSVKRNRSTLELIHCRCCLVLHVRFLFGSGWLHVLFSPCFYLWQLLASRVNTRHRSSHRHSSTVSFFVPFSKLYLARYVTRES